VQPLIPPTWVPRCNGIIAATEFFGDDIQCADAAAASPAAVEMVYEYLFLHETANMIRLVAAVSDKISYSGSWLLGVHLGGMHGLISQLSDSTLG
jgi:hypothetical protein